MPFWRRHPVWFLLLLLLGAGVVVARVGTSQPSLELLVDKVAETLKEELGLTLVVGHIQVEAGSARAEVGPIAIKDMDGVLLFSAKKILVELAPLPFFAQRVEVDVFDVDDPMVHIRIKDGSIEGIKKINLEKSDDDGRLFRVDINDFRVTNGRIRVDVDDKIQISTFFEGIKARLRSTGPDGHRLKFKVQKATAVRPKTETHPEDVITVDSFGGRMVVFGDGLLAPERIAISEISVATEKASARVGGTLLLGKLDLVPAFDVDVNVTAGLPDVLSHLALPVAVEGAVNVGVHVSSDSGLKNIQLVGQGDAADLKVDGFVLGSLRGRFQADEKEVIVPTATWQYADTVLTGSGSVKLDEALSFEMDADFDRFSLYKMLENLQVKGSWAEFFATGHMAGSGVILPNFRFEGMGKGIFTDLIVRDHDARVDDGRQTILEDPNAIDVNVRFLADLEHVHIAGILDDGFTHADGFLDLWFDFAKGFEVKAIAERAGFGSLGGRIAMLNFTGDGYSTLHIKGPYDAPAIHADTTIHGLTLEGYDFGTMKGHISYDDGILGFTHLDGRIGSSIYKGEILLDWFRDMKLRNWHDAREKRKVTTLRPHNGLHITANIDVVRGMLQELRAVIPPIYDDGVLGFFRTLEADGPATSVVRMQGYIGDGSIDHIMGSATLDIGAGATLLGQTLDYGHMNIEIAERKVLLRDVELGVAGGILLTEVDIFRDDGEMNGTLVAQDLSLGKIDTLKGTSRTFTGTLDLNDGVLSNYAQDPTLKGRAVLLGAAWGEISIGDADFDLDHVHRRLTLTGKMLSERADGVIQVETIAPYAYDASLRIATGMARPLLPPDLLSENISVELGGNVGLHGELSSFSSSRGTLTLDPVVFTLDGIAFKSTADVLGHFKGDRVTIDQLELSSARSDILAMRGVVSSDVIDLQLSGRGDLWMVPSFTKWVKSSSGIFSFDVVVTGDWDSASMNGKGTIAGGRFDIDRFDPILDDLNARLTFQGPNVRIDSLRTMVDGAPTRGRGTITLDGFSPASYDLRIDYKNLRLRIPEWLPSRTSGLLTLSGPAAFPTLAGDVTVHQATYSEDTTPERLVKDIRRKVRTPLVFDKAEEDVRFDLHLIAGGGILVQNNMLDIEAKGDLFLVGTEERPGLKGHLSILHGNATFRNNRYRVASGNVEFVETYRIVPVFDFDLDTTVKDYDINVGVMGRLTDLSWSLGSRPALAEVDILSLLTLGFTHFDLDNIEGNAVSAVGLEALNMVGAYTGLDDEVRRLVPEAVRELGVFNMDELRLTSQFSERQGANVPAVAVGFGLDPGVDFLDGSRLKLQTTVFDDGGGTPQQSVQWEKRFDNNLRLNVRWDSQDESGCQGCRNQFGDPGIDLRWSEEF
ncbi:MAG: hypothetical protein GY822_27460 [Deltaproteobacteria bacterium]|nr:hypothetical protein [Deltaproteobacteria bacterium]